MSDGIDEHNIHGRGCPSHALTLSLSQVKCDDTVMFSPSASEHASSEGLTACWGRELDDSSYLYLPKLNVSVPYDEVEQGYTVYLPTAVDKVSSHPSHHSSLSLLHSSFSSFLAAWQNHMEKGPNFTDGKDLYMVGAYNCLMVQTPANQRYLWLVSLRHHPNRARDSSLPSCLLTHKRCSRPRVPASQ